MEGKGKNKNFVVTFHMSSTGYTDCCGVYRTFEKALGCVYERIYDKSIESYEDYSNFQISLPKDAEGQNAWIVSYSYEDRDGDVQADEYYLIYDNRRVERGK